MTRFSKYIARFSVFSILLTIPVFVGLFMPSSYCSISVANAQDNPCLAQDATITAQEFTIFQLQTDNTNLSAANTDLMTENQALQAIIDTYEADGITPIDPLDDSASGFPFIETFDNNNNGWQLVAGTSLTGGELLLNDGASDWGCIDLPIRVPDSFQLDVDVRDNANDEGEGFYFAFGDFDQNTYHTIEWSRAYNPHTDIFIYDSGADSTILSLDNITGSIDYDIASRIGFAYKNGQVEIYRDGVLLTTTNLTSYGNQFALCRASRTRAVHYDNLEIRALP